MPTAFVTGGTGFLGFNIVLELLERGWRVVALHRDSSDTTSLAATAAERVLGDVTDPESLRAAIPDGVDAVFHAAADLTYWSRHNERQHRINVGGTRHAVEAALARGARRFVHTSSIVAYGLHDERIDETAALAGAASWIGYVRTKALAEAEIHRGIERGLDAVILNPANIVGPGDRTSWARVIRGVARGKLPFIGPGGGSFCHGREVAKAHVAAVEAAGVGESFLLGGADASYLEFASIAAELAGGRPPRRLPAGLLRVLGRLGVLAAAVTGARPAVTPETAALVSHWLLCDSSKAIERLGYRPLPLRRMIEDSYRWLREQGLLGGR